MADTGDRKARRTALRIVIFLGVLVALSCLGGVAVFQGTLGDLKRGLEALDVEVAERFPQGTLWMLVEETAAMEQRAPTDAVHLVLVVGVPTDAPAGDIDAWRAEAWDAYCEAFAGGGLHLGSVAIGTAGAPQPHPDLHSFGNATGWEETLEDVSSLEGRTGRPAPPDLAIVEWFGNSIRIGEDGER
jgi:hypothetical protein